MGDQSAGNGVRTRHPQALRMFEGQHLANLGTRNPAGAFQFVQVDGEGYAVSRGDAADSFRRRLLDRSSDVMAESVGGSEGGIGLSIDFPGCHEWQVSRLNRPLRKLATKYAAGFPWAALWTASVFDSRT